MKQKQKKRRHQSPEQKLEQARAKGRRDAMDEAVTAMMYIVLYTLKDKNGRDRRFSEAIR